MARQLKLKPDAFDLEKSKNLTLPIFLTAEETRLQLAQQQSTSLALSPKLQQWFDKQFPIRPRE
jgi:hypothetical protein